MPLLASVAQIQQHMGEVARKNPECRFERLHRTLCDERWLTEAWKRIRSNKGSKTAGVDGMTRNDVDETLIHQLAKKLKNQEFKPTPVRRTYIPKSKGKLRPLGIPTIQDRIVQSALKMILEPVWEQDFRDCSHGFRPERSCHTALSYVAMRFPRSTWIIEGDITGCFNNIDHGKLMGFLRLRLKDEKLLQLIYSFLKAGYMEQWIFHRTYSGTPQGGVVSPVLANIYLHELDKFMEVALKANRKESKQEMNARRSPESRMIEGRITRLRGLLKGKKRSGRILKEVNLSQEERKQTIIELKQLGKEREKLPSLKTQEKVGYVRYADDFLIILQGYPKAKAEEIRERLREFMGEHLGLELNAEKTLITHPAEEIRFLGYQLRSRGGRYKSLKLEIPKRAKEELLEKVNKLSRLHHMDEVDMLIRTSSFVRGWMEYYKYANAPQKTFSDVNAKVFWAMAHYLGRKHKTSMPRILKKFGITVTKNGRTRKTLGKQVKGKTFELWCFPPKTGSIYKVKSNPQVNAYPTETHEWELGSF